MSLFAKIYSRNSVYVASIFAGAFAFQGFFDTFTTKVFENHNKGKLWKDVKGKFLEAADENDDE